MKRSPTAVLLSLALLFSFAGTALAEDGDLTGYLGSFHGDLQRANEKILGLADAIPADKYGWRPAEGVRSVSETFIHIAMANFFIGSTLGGGEMPEGYGMDAEQKITAKDDVVKALKESFVMVEKAAAANAAKDLDEKLQLFGREMGRRDAFMIISGHAHEHMGQMIAYARSIGVTPPWSQPREEAEGGEGDGEGG